MINKLEIHNIQSHKDTTLEFCNGINAIVGSSDNGKTAILRALCWARYNRPLGIDVLCSHWAIDTKGTQSDDMWVEVTKGNDTLVRRKYKGENQYIVNGEVLNAVKTDVPDKVEDFFKMSNTNFQMQHDSPFLLSLSSGEVAKYFNSIVHLDVIDKVLSNAESERRKLNVEINHNDQQLVDANIKHKKFEWIYETDDKIKELSDLENNIKSMKTELIELKEQLEKIAVYQSKIKDLSKFNNIITNVLSLNNTIQEYSEIKLDIENTLRMYKEITDKNFNFDIPKKQILKYDNLTSKINNNDYDTLKEQIEEYVELESSIRCSLKKIEEYKSALPDTCPLCGGVIKGVHNENH